MAAIPVPVSRRIARRVRFDQVRYANCWEDADVLCEALTPVPGKRILSIASAGDNTLALLAHGATVVAVDLSEAQLACLELRCAAFRRLAYEPMLGFLGIRPCGDRWTTYERLEADLSDASRRHWRGNPQHVRMGIIHAGRFERYFQTFRRWVLPMIHRRRTVQAMLCERTADQQRVFYDQHWNHRRWRALFRLFFGRLAMGKLGRDPEFFRYVQGNVGHRLLSRVEHGLRQVPTHSNPYLHFILNGNFGNALPRYLRPEHFQQIRHGLDRLTIHHGGVEEAAAVHGNGGFDGYNLSDVFEYMDAEGAALVYAQLLSTASPGAVLVYWNTLVDRSCPQQLADRVEPLEPLAMQLHARDRAFFYSKLVVERVR